MNVRLSTPHSALRTPRLDRAFTMVEIALSLAIIGFALVAIIGVLPAGMSVQKDNREQTIINLDAAFLMDALRSGPQGQDDLTNYVVSIVQTNALYLGNPPALSVTTVNTFNTNQTVINGTSGNPTLTNGFNIIGLLSAPKYFLVTNSAPPPSPPIIGFWSNSVTAVLRAINAPAVDQGLSQASRDFAFQYQVTIEIVPSADYAYLAITNGNWINLTAPTAIATRGFSPNDESLGQHTQDNLYDLRLTFRWPVLPNGQLGGGKQVFRSSVAGTYGINTLVYPNGPNLYFMQPLTYTAQR